MAEIKYPKSVREQIIKLIDTGIIEILSEKTLPPPDKIIYQAVFEKLSNVMMNKYEPNKNLGEVCSLAIAKVKMIPLFYTEEKRLQSIIDANLNNKGMSEIKCINLFDVLKLVADDKISGLNRKTAKTIWRMSGKANEEFDKYIWPLH